MKYVILQQIIQHRKCYFLFLNNKDFIIIDHKKYGIIFNYKNVRCDKYYDTNSFSNSARTTGFGFGQKYDFSKTARCSPPCNSYNLKSDFNHTNT